MDKKIKIKKLKIKINNKREILNKIKQIRKNTKRKKLAEKLQKKREVIKKKNSLQEKKENINKSNLKLIFDVETNGLHYCSVLSFSALVLDENNNIVDVINRYYFKEPYEKNDSKALSINGLYESVIKAKRKNATYSKYFREDEEIESLINSCDVLIAHNIDFDLSHIKNAFNINTSRKRKYCTMLATMHLYNAPYKVDGHPKYPKLSEAVKHFNIDIKIIKKITRANYHDSLFDCYCVYEIYKRLSYE